MQDERDFGELPRFCRSISRLRIEEYHDGAATTDSPGGLLPTFGGILATGHPTIRHPQLDLSYLTLGPLAIPSTTSGGSTDRATLSPADESARSRATTQTDTHHETDTEERRVHEVLRRSNDGDPSGMGPELMTTDETSEPNDAIRERSVTEQQDDTTRRNEVTDENNHPVDELGETTWMTTESRTIQQTIGEPTARSRSIARLVLPTPNAEAGESLDRGDHRTTIRSEHTTNVEGRESDRTTAEHRTERSHLLERQNEPTTVVDRSGDSEEDPESNEIQHESATTTDGSVGTPRKSSTSSQAAPTRTETMDGPSSSNAQQRFRQSEFDFEADQSVDDSSPSEGSDRLVSMTGSKTRRSQRQRERPDLVTTRATQSSVTSTTPDQGEASVSPPSERSSESVTTTSATTGASSSDSMSASSPRLTVRKSGPTESNRSSTAGRDSDDQRPSIALERPNDADGKRQKTESGQTKKGTDPKSGPDSSKRSASTEQIGDVGGVDPLTMLETDGERRQQFIDELYRALERKRAIERQRGLE